METYKFMVISGKNIESIPPISNVLVNIVLHNNEGAIPIRCGQGNPLIGLVGGKDYFEITIFNIANKIKELVKDKIVSIYLCDNNFQFEISNVTLKYEQNNIIFKTKSIIRRKK